MPILRPAPVLLPLALLALATAARAADEDLPTQAVALLRQNCWDCHGEKKQKGKLRLDSREAALKGGEDHGAAVVPGHPERSAMIAAVKRGDEDTAMPPKKEKALSAAQVDLLTRWITAGAEWPAAH